VQRAQVRPGEWVLVVGAGPIGLGTMEFARIAGAKVIALDLNEGRLRFCKERLKVDHTIHAASPDVLQQVREITGGDMPTVVFDATGNLKAINGAFGYVAHGGRYVLIGLQKGDIAFSHPEFHKREATLLSSRNATRQDFAQVLAAIQRGEVDPATYITHRVAFEKASGAFASWLNPASGVIKAMIEMP
ncbi:MAG: zinc-binding dehydrogenase, partial [Cytophagales bacterium]|nr:zinc-binding dehydrogenase [Cytophagales bacterium]